MGADQAGRMNPHRVSHRTIRMITHFFEDFKTGDAYDFTIPAMSKPESMAFAAAWDLKVMTLQFAAMIHRREPAAPA